MQRFLNWLKRPEIQEQNTGRQAFQQYQGYSFAGIVGNGGQMVKRSLNAANPATITVGPTIKTIDGNVTGNPNTNVTIQPLSEGDNRSL